MKERMLSKFYSLVSSCESIQRTSMSIPNSIEPWIWIYLYEPVTFDDYSFPRDALCALWSSASENLFRTWAHFLNVPKSLSVQPKESWNVIVQRGLTWGLNKKYDLPYAFAHWIPVGSFVKFMAPYLTLSWCWASKNILLNILS